MYVFCLLLSPVILQASEITPIDAMTEDMQLTSAPFFKDISAEKSNPSKYAIDFSDTESTKKQQAGAGENILVLPSSGTSVFNIENGKYVFDKKIELSDLESNSSYALILNDGIIISATDAIITTLGGTENVSYMYDSVDSLIGDVEGIPIHGGAQDGIFNYSTYNDGNVYYNITIGGYTGFIDSNDAQIIPSQFTNSQTHYENNDGIWTQYIATDPLISEEYETLELGLASEEAIENVQYIEVESGVFKPLTEQYKSNTISNDVYFKNLPFRSTSSYSASQFQSYLKYVGFSNSGYYNATSAFFEAQEIYGVNALLLFAMANHESFYGTSSYAKKCNNFFGRGAYDTNPNNACESYGFTDARSGILAQGSFLNTEYFDVKDFRYAGSHAGDKSSGINVYYASDVNWGNKLASHAYKIDKYLGGKENSKFRIAEITQEVQIYKDSNLKTPINYTYANGTSIPYKTVRQYINKIDAKTTANPRAVIIDETASALKIQVDTPLNFGKSGTYDWSSAISGQYPKFNGSIKVNVKNGEASPHVQYGKMSDQQFWIPKSTSVGKSYKLLNDVPAVDTEATETIFEYYSSGQVKYKYYLKKDGSIDYAIGYNSTGNIISAYEYYPNTFYGRDHGRNIKYFYQINKEGYITAAEMREKLTGKDMYKYEYYENTIFNDNHGSNIKYIYKLKKDESIDYAEKKENITGKVTNYYEYYPSSFFGNNQGSHIKYLYSLNKDGSIKGAEQRENNSGKILKKYEYYPSAFFGKKHGQNIKYRYDLDESGYIREAFGFENNSQIKLTSYKYYPKTKYGNHACNIKEIIYYSNDGKIIKREKRVANC